MVPDIRQSDRNSHTLQQWLVGCGIKDAVRGAEILRLLSRLPWTDDDFVRLANALSTSLPTLADPDRALNNLERLTSAAASIAQQVRTMSALKSPFLGLMTVLSDSQYLADLLQEESCFEIVCRGQFQPVAKRKLIDQCVESVAKTSSQAEAMRIIREFKRKQTLRIAWGDLVLGHHVEQVASQISFVAIAVCEAALFWCRRRVKEKFGLPSAVGTTCRYVILALGKLGGNELNYSSDIDLIAVYETDAEIKSGTKSTNQEYFAQLTRDFIRVVGHPTELGSAYRVDMRLRPSGSRGAICKSVRSAIQYYDLQGRTWERQAMIKARPIAGDLSLGVELLEQLQRWVFAPTFTHADIEGVKSLKRQIEKRTRIEGDEQSDIKTGYGGIRDVEFVIQFMQLLNAWNLSALRTANTIRAIGRLERNHCLTHDEAGLLANNYRWLRKLEHRLQIMNNQQTHRLPDSKTSRAAIARRMGVHRDNDEATLRDFESRLREVTRLNRTILNHILHGAYGAKSVLGGSEESVSAEVDLILDPDPDMESIQKVLSPYGFSNVESCYKILMQLTEESSQFVSSRRCKHFFASIASALLSQISQTPSPDHTLIALATISDSLGAKGVLWELFSESPSTLELYVQLCASSDYLATILKSNPGMVDELLDALQLDSLPDHAWIRSSLESLLRGAHDPGLILNSFKTTQHLRIGVRDILGQDRISQTHSALAAVAESCLAKVACWQFQQLAARHRLNPELSLNDTSFVILAMGKLGGREPNYHSDLDVIFLFHRDAAFESELPGSVSSQTYFNELSKSIAHAVSDQRRGNRLYELDSRLRPTGSSGTLAVNVSEFLRYFRDGEGQLWERQALCKARAILGTDPWQAKTREAIDEILSLPLPHDYAAQIWKMRLALESDCRGSNLKRGPGGTVDIEFTVQMLQLGAFPRISSTGTLATIEQLAQQELLSQDTAAFFTASYELLRSVESGLRLMNTTARHDLPSDQDQLARLAYLLNYPSGDSLKKAVADCREAVRDRTRRIFDTAIDANS